MDYTIKDHGVWEVYRPAEIPEGFPRNAAFARRVGDGVDWYEYLYAEDTWGQDTVKATCEPQPDGLIVQAIQRDETTIFPGGMRVIEISGVPTDEEKPHKLFEQQVYDPGPKTISPRPEPPVTSVAATQAKIQLFRTKRDGSDLLAMTKALVAASGDVELELWFNGAQTWRTDNVHVQNIGGYFGLSPAEIQDLFTAANQIDA